MYLCFTSETSDTLQGGTQLTDWTGRRTIRNAVIRFELRDGSFEVNATAHIAITGSQLNVGHFAGGDSTARDFSITVIGDPLPGFGTRRYKNAEVSHTHAGIINETVFFDAGTGEVSCCFPNTLDANHVITIG